MNLAPRRLVIQPHLQWVITYIFRHDSVDLGAVVQESHTTLSIYPHCSYVFDPVPMLNGLCIQEGSLLGGFMPQEPLSGGSSMHCLLSEGSGLPSSMPSPPWHLTVYFPLKSSWKGNFMDEMFWAGTMVAAFLICLGVLYSTCQAYHKLLCNSMDSARIVTLLVFIATGVLFFQMHQTHSGYFQEGLVALEFP